MKQNVSLLFSNRMTARHADLELAIGILSEPMRREYFHRRQQIRASWLPHCKVELGCTAAFIFGQPPARAAELADSVIVNASEDPAVTTIAKTLGWYRIASRWQSLRFICVVDDDVVANPMGILRDLRRNPQAQLWGALEFASYDVLGLDMPVWADSQRGAMRRHALETLRRREPGVPASSLQERVRRASLRQLATTLRDRTGAVRALRGPYPFPKGPAFVLSASLSSALTSSRCVRRLDLRLRARASEVSELHRRHRKPPPRLLHDLLVGLYLSECAHELPALALYNIGVHKGVSEFRRWQRYDAAPVEQRAALRYVHFGSATSMGHDSMRCRELVWSNL